MNTIYQKLIPVLRSAICRTLSIFTLILVLSGLGNTTMAISPGLNTASDDTASVFSVVEQMPEIVGGIQELYKNIRYPRAAVQQGIEGRVFVQFIVDRNGNVREPEILRDIGAGCGEAAVEAIMRTQFTPGRQNGVPVDVRFSIPVTFRIVN